MWMYFAMFTDEDARVNGPQILKSVSTAKCVSLTVESPIKEVLHDLLNCLITEYNYQEDGKGTSTGLLPAIEGNSNWQYMAFSKHLYEYLSWWLHV